MFTTPTYETSAPLRGDRDAALTVARGALTALGFAIESESDSELRAEGPGMTHNKQPALLGVTTLRLRVSGSVVSARAALGGVGNMKLFLYLFPPGLGLMLFVGFAVSGMGMAWIALLAVAPWLVLSPLLATMLERRTRRAVDTLVRNMASERSTR